MNFPKNSKLRYSREELLSHQPATPLPSAIQAKLSALPRTIPLQSHQKPKSQTNNKKSKRKQKQQQLKYSRDELLKLSPITPKPENESKTTKIPDSASPKVVRKYANSKLRYSREQLLELENKNIVIRLPFIAEIIKNNNNTETVKSQDKRMPTKKTRKFHVNRKADKIRS